MILTHARGLESATFTTAPPPRPLNWNVLSLRRSISSAFDRTKIRFDTRLQILTSESKKTFANLSIKLVRKLEYNLSIISKETNYLASHFKIRQGHTLLGQADVEMSNLPSFLPNGPVLITHFCCWGNRYLTYSQWVNSFSLSWFEMVF